MSAHRITLNWHYTQSVYYGGLLAITYPQKDLTKRQKNHMAPDLHLNKT